MTLVLLALLLDNLLPSNSYDLAIIPAIIGAVGALGAGVAGAIGGSKSTSSANSMNYKINQLNNEFNAAEAQKSRDYMTEMWNKTNEYNSPSAQRQRLAEAGYNPYCSETSISILDNSKLRYSSFSKSNATRKNRYCCSG